MTEQVRVAALTGYLATMRGFGADPLGALNVSELALGAAAGSEEAMQWGEDANRYPPELQAFDRIPEASPLWLNVQIPKAFALNSLDRVDDAKPATATAFLASRWPMMKPNGVWHFSRQRYLSALN